MVGYDLREHYSVSFLLLYNLLSQKDYPLRMYYALIFEDITTLSAYESIRVNWKWYLQENADRLVDVSATIYNIDALKSRLYNSWDFYIVRKSLKP